MKSSLCKDALCLLLLLSNSFLCFGSSVDFITSIQFIKDPETVSSGGFKLGFFSPKNSTNRYVGIWYLSEFTVIWVANRIQPVTDSSGVFTISEDGNLVVLNDKKHTLWSSNVSNILPNSSVAKLLDTGNYVVRDSTTGNTLWESFQHPSDSFLPKMKLGMNPRTGEKARLKSWKSPFDPSIGSFSASIERPDAPEVLVYNESKPYWRSGPWNGRIFLGIYWMSTQYLRGFYIGKQEDSSSYINLDLANKSYMAVFKLNSKGNWVATGWINKKQVGNVTLQNSECDLYVQCGAFGYCNLQSSPICTCLDGFEPKSPEESNQQNWTNGCVRKAPLQCKGDGFLKPEMMKVPDFIEPLNGPAENCSKQCLQNCSCLAYAYDASIGCMSWSANLIDIQRFPYGGVDLYIHLAHSELDKRRGKRRNKWKMTAIIAISAAVGATSFATCSYFIWTIVSRYKGKTNQNGQSDSIIEDPKEKLDELPLFEFEKLAIAANNFHPSNKLGQRGFGPVYKGELQGSQVIAVKRLSRASGQGP